MVALMLSPGMIFLSLLTVIIGRYFYIFYAAQQRTADFTFFFEAREYVARFIFGPVAPYRAPRPPPRLLKLKKPKISIITYIYTVYTNHIYINLNN